MLFRMVAEYRWVDIIGTSFTLDKSYALGGLEIKCG